MNMKKIGLLLLTVCSLSVLSHAGVLQIQATDKSTDFESKKINLSQVDSIKFSKKGAVTKMAVSGKSGFSTDVSNIENIDFDLKKGSSESITIKIGSGVYKGVAQFALSDVASIDFETIEDTLDSDGDGLSDIKEIYLYDTNPKSADTDGDSWNDGEELADGMFNPNNPTSFNPKIADVPSLEIASVLSPKIILKVETTSGSSKNITVSEGKENSSSMTISSESSRSSSLENSWQISTTQGWEVGLNNKWVGSISVGYSGSYTSTDGFSWGSEEQTAVAESFEKAVSEEVSEGSTILGAELCNQVKLTNTSAIAYTIESLVLSASIYRVSGNSSIQVIADLVRDGASTDWKATLKPNESTEALFCNTNLPVERIKDLIYNADALILGASTQKITFTAADKNTMDFTEAYTKVNGKTANVIIDYGPGAIGKEIERYFVATNYRYNEDHTGSNDMYDYTSLSQILSTLEIPFEQDSVEARDDKKNYGLASINSFSNSKKDDAWWYIMIDAASDLKLKNKRVTIYSAANGSFDMNRVMIGSGDAVQFFYSKDADGDGLPVRTEVLLGTSDSKIDTDGDGLTDYEEVQGYTFPETPDVTFYSDPAKADTDGDGIDDKTDENPMARSLFKSAIINTLKVMNEAEDLIFECSNSSTKCSDNMKTNRINEGKVKVEFKVEEPLRSVQISLRNSKLPVGKKVRESVYIKPSSDKFYSYAVSNALSISSADTLFITLTSEDELTVKTYSVALPSSLGKPSNLKLGANSEKTSIVGAYSASKDTRVQGYLVVRGDGTCRNDTFNLSTKSGFYSENSYIGKYLFSSTTSLPVAGLGLKDELSVISQNTGLSFEDKVGSGSPYYSYKVYAYAEENGTYYFSEGSNTATRSVGRIGVTYTWTNVGGNDANCYASRNCDYAYYASLYEGTNSSGTLITKFPHVYKTNVGAGGSEDNITWYSVSQRTYFYNLGNTSLYLDLNLTADKGTHKYSGSKNRVWNYSNMRDVLITGTVPDGTNAPKNNKATEITGIGSGGDRKGGYKFLINYFYIDDNASY